LSRAAAELETASRNGDDPVVGEALPAFREALGALASRVGEALSERRRAGGGEEPQGADFVSALTGLGEALQTKDIEAIDLAMERLRATPAGGQANAVAELEDLVLVASFKEAADRLADLLARVEP
jgi:hypothetical protein